MPAQRLRNLTEVVEPPRDGEFFFDEAMEEGRTNPSVFSVVFGGIVGRHPLLALGVVIAAGTVVASLFL